MILVDTNIILRYLLGDNEDCMLFSYAKNEKYNVKTFDKKLNKIIEDSN